MAASQSIGDCWNGPSARAQHELRRARCAGRDRGTASRCRGSCSPGRGPRAWRRSGRCRRARRAAGRGCRASRAGAGAPRPAADRRRSSCRPRSGRAACAVRRWMASSTEARPRCLGRDRGQALLEGGALRHRQRRRARHQVGSVEQPAEQAELDGVARADHALRHPGRRRCATGAHRCPGARCSGRASRDCRRRGSAARRRRDRRRAGGSGGWPGSARRPRPRPAPRRPSACRSAGRAASAVSPVGSRARPPGSTR